MISNLQRRQNATNRDCRRRRRLAGHLFQDR